MTHYAFDEARSALIATWGTGAGDVATTIAELPCSCPAEQAVHLAHALTRLSDVAWKCYTHPASAADSIESNSEGRRRQAERQSFSEVFHAVRAPYLVDNGGVVRSYIPVVEAAHALGRALHVLDNSDVTSLIAAEVHRELNSIERAELGDFSGRSRQAVLLTREDASPLQVAAADEVFYQHPRGDRKLFTHVEPTAAAVVAAHWLQAAATVAAAQSGIVATNVVYEADNIEAIETDTPSRVLELMAVGLTPRKAVTSLIREAMHVAEGVILSPAAVIIEIKRAEKLRRRTGSNDPIRATTLDPIRAAPDLLEGLIDGIHGCWLLYREHASGVCDFDADDVVDDDRDEDVYYNRMSLMFEEAVRAEAKANQERLL